MIFNKRSSKYYLVQLSAILSLLDIWRFSAPSSRPSPPVNRECNVTALPGLIPLPTWL